MESGQISTSCVVSISFFCLLVFSPIMIFAQDSIPATVNSQKTDSISQWSFYAEGDYYIFPADQNIFMVTATADKDMLHLEARYNYEDRYTASVFRRFEFFFRESVEIIADTHGRIGVWTVERGSARSGNSAQLQNFQF